MTFYLSPIVRITLGSLYLALTLPLPFLSQVTHAAVPPLVLTIGLVLGALLLWGALSEQVVVTETTIGVRYPWWFPWQKGWEVEWQEIVALKPRTTGQGGLVYYLVSRQDQAYLLPMRIAGFARLVDRVQQKTGIDTRDVRPLAQPWMYFILMVFTIGLLLVDGVTLLNLPQLT